MHIKREVPISIGKATARRREMVECFRSNGIAFCHIHASFIMVNILKASISIVVQEYNSLLYWY